MVSHARSRRHTTAIAVPGAVAVLIAGAFAAAPALAASPAPSLPFPTVCASGQSASGSGSASASPSATSPSASASTSPSPSSTSSSGSASPSTTASGTATPTGTQPAAGPKKSASPSASASGTGSAPASPSPTPSTSSSSSGGFWGWLNGVWTWIFSDDAQSTAQHSVIDAVAPLNDNDANRGGAHFEAAAAALGGKQGTTPSPNCISSASAAALAAKAAANGTSEGVYAGTIPWVMKTPVLTLYDLTYNGVKTVSVLDKSTGKYTDEQVLDFTASKLTIKSMVTYSIQNGQTVYNNAGSGTTTTLTNPHLMTVSLSGSLFGLIPQTYTPSNQPPLPVGLTIPLIPVVFTGVTTQLAYLHTGAISVPGFDGFAQNGIASPQ